MNTINRLHNVTNPAQGAYKRVLCLCSAGLLRSPTAAWVLSNPPYNYNTRAAGLTPEYALVPVDEVLLGWADEVVVMESWMADELAEKYGYSGPLVVLDIRDMYEYRSPELIAEIREGYGDEEVPWYE